MFLLGGADRRTSVWRGGAERRSAGWAGAAQWLKLRVATAAQRLRDPKGLAGWQLVLASPKAGE